MDLQTQIPLVPERNQIDYTSKVLLLGSCFAEHIGNKLAYGKFQQLQNPFGIVFHPLAIESLLTRAINDRKFTEADVVKNNERWFCFDAHSSFAATTQEALLQRLNESLAMLSAYIQEASHIILTLGTAWVYRHIAQDAIVANCHKVKQKEFLKELLSVAEVSASLERITVLLQETNKQAQLIFTVSPVRHLKDGFVENNRSKAHLISGVHDAIEKTKRTFYFPAYELLIDELRDYRFYTEDMLHPTATAVMYIWEKFKFVWVSQETASLQKEIETIQKGLQHRPFHPNSESHVKFQQDLQLKIEALQRTLPFVKF